ncbi:MAG: T9SS type A sorting domain-containing protein, partial [Bacteroidota bacterium]
VKALGADGGYSYVHQQDPNVGYMEIQNGNLRRSTNIQSSNPTSLPIHSQITSVDNTLFIAPFEVNRTDGDQIYFCSQHRIWRTNNQGSNWNAITNSHYTIYGVGVTKDTDPTVYFGGSSANIYRIDNATSASAGDEVNLSNSVPSSVTSHTISDIKPHPTDNTKAYVTFSTINSQSRVWRVDNIHTNSPTWVDISGNLPSSLPCNSMEVLPSNDQSLYLGTDFGLYCSTDGGNSWAKETSVPNVSVHQVQLRESDEKLFVFTHGRGAWAAETTNGGGGGGQQYAGIPYTTGFESGLDQFWATSSNDARGRIQVTTANGPNSGAQHLTMDVTTSGSQVRNRADLHLNLSGASDVELRFWWKEFSDEDHSKDAVYFSDDGGSSYTKVHSLTGGPATYTEVVLDLDSLAGAHGLSLNSSFIVRFQQRDNQPINSDGFAFDDISVAVPGNSVLPYSTSFDSGLDANWTLSTTDAVRGRVQVTSANGPHSGAQHLTMDVTTSGSAVSNRADLAIDLSGESNVELSFWLKEFNDDNNAKDAVYFSDDGGASFSKVYSLNSATASYAQVVLDVDNLASNKGLTLNENFVIRFQHRGDDAIPSDGFAFDDVLLISVGADPFTETEETITATDLLVPDATAPWTVALYPNPASTEVFLTISGDGANQPANIVFYDLQGRVVRQQQQVTAGAGSPNHIAIDDLSQGTYLVEVISGENREVLRLVKP